MSHYTVADFVIDHLEKWGVNRIFGYSGDAINPVVSALNKENMPIKFVQGRHEEMCAFMACAHAKFTGEVGVCLSTSGPGAIHLLNGLYDAKMDNQPVLAIVGQQARKALGTSFMQDVDLSSLFKDVAHEYINVASSPEQVRHLIDRSMITAYSKRCVTCLILPHDIQTAKAKPEPERVHGQSFSGICFPDTAVVPPLSEISKAAALLNGAEKIAILVGAGALKAGEQVKELAEVLGAGVAKALLGKAAVEDGLPFVTGCIGLLGTEASSQMMKHCDAFVMVGTNFPYAEFLPRPGSAKAVQIDLDPANIALRYPVDIGLIGDSAATLKLLLPMLRKKTDDSWRKQIEGWIEEWESVLRGRATGEAPTAGYVNPERVFAELSSQLPDNAIVTSDSGMSTVWYARHLKMKPGMLASVSGALASMGCSVPYAIAAKFAFPSRPLIVCSGDGAMQMAGNNELITVAKYWREWADPRFVVVVLKNNDLNFVTWEMRTTEGDPRFAAAQDIPDFPYADYAQSLGLGGFKIEASNSDTASIRRVISQAFLAAKPVVIEVLADPNVPPLPPSVSFGEASMFGIAMAKEGVDAAGPIIGSIKEMWNSLNEK
jgi:pyruvate dehydrogenase (quinone)